MNQQNFIASCFSQLVETFENAKCRKKDDKQKHRTEGFIQAGKALGLLSHSEATELMEKAHHQVFGESIKSRKSRKANLKEAIEQGDTDFINIPACERN
ncbi:hypothetical protein Q4574_07735 [Aliiglaciecola sp. 3_MG-2023]|uniref:hypothetical protein n=1 Tax=Aliiglaciecola sp. 3_MG-2023 TaxID=3062644 RepID=UPI0026E30280|nr:hypothetical protein [Aliiglaciecola sp. 3_MG-2023]MDO6693172.1 hypothetical protein [Aliiglaciecola sp. 3_MG-2023]